ncbi:MAG TPA: hypothetical protein VEU52_11320 [Candidatus Limnocylindrales bacterium]|nr:hypothetical protein [Candidatus Limnocylindrales bacterium]
MIAVLCALVAAGGSELAAQQTPGQIPDAKSESAAAHSGPDNRPLPDIPKLLRDVNKNQRALEEIRKLYTCHLSEKEDKLDSNGQVKSTSMKEYDVFYVGDDQVRHLLAKDGKPLNPSEQIKEDAKFNKEFDELKKKQAELANNPKKQAKREEEDEAQLSDFLRAERFTNPRRERHRGKEVIAFDFAANPEYKAKKEIDRIIQKLSGVVWVDEEAREIVRLEARVDEPVKLGGGLLASLHPGSNVIFEQEKINEEVWMPSYMEVHVDARIVILKFRENAVDRYSEYKKFRVGTALGSSEPAPGTEQSPESKPPSH